MESAVVFPFETAIFLFGAGRQVVLTGAPGKEESPKTMDNIVIVGSSGHAKVVIDIVQLEGKYRIAGLLDRTRRVGEQTLGYRVLGQEEDLPKLKEVHALHGAFVAIGDNFVRSRAVALVKEFAPELPFVRAVHPAACLAPGTSIGEGTAIMAGAVVNPCCAIGRHCILNTHCSLDHDSQMADFASLAPGATLGGKCRIGPFAAICIGAVLVHDVHIGEHAVIGAGALVTHSMDPFVVAYGSPAKVVRTRAPGDKYV